MTSTHRLVIELQEEKFYKAFLTSGDRRRLFSTLNYQLAQADGADETFEQWRCFLEKVLRENVAAVLGLVPDQVTLERFNLITYAHINEEGGPLSMTR